MKKIISILFCIALLTCVACANDDLPLSDHIDTEASIGETEVEPESADIIYDVNNLSQEQKYMIYPMDLVSYTDVPDEDAVWDAVFEMLCDTWYDEFLVDEIGIGTFGGPGLVVPESFIQELFSALCSDFDGTLPPYPTNFPEGTTWSYSYKEGDNYSFAQGDRGEDGMYTWRITSWIQHADGRHTVEAVRDWDLGYTDYEKYLFDPNVTYRFELTENTYTKDFVNPLFAYTIVGFEKIDGYLLSESDSRYYTEDELSGWSSEDLRYARNEIYARHGYIFDSEDLKNYFEEKSWYEGTVASDDFDESAFNEYEKANIELILSIENGGFSFSDMNEMTLWFSSGAGAWATTMIVYADGTFDGVYNDWNGIGTDLSGNEHYNFNYNCEFYGKFSEPTKVDQYIYSTKVESLDYKNAVNTEETVDDAFYVYTDPYGIGRGESVLIYTPGMRILDLPEGAIDWNFDLSSNRDNITSDMILETYVIYTESGVFWGEMSNGTENE